jgi:hypothetical protein
VTITVRLANGDTLEYDVALLPDMVQVLDRPYNPKVQINLGVIKPK